MPQKTVNRFIFVRFRRCKNSSPALPLAYKSTSTVAFCPVKDTMQRPCQLIAIFHAEAFVSVVSAFRVHFLTFIDNYPIFQ